LASGFPGFPREGIEFFRGLARHNHRDWFQPRKHIFDRQVKQPMSDLVAAVNRALLGFAPEYVTDPSKAIYRIYRDTRFSADKTPYKDHIAANFRWKGAGRHQGAGYYFAVSHKEVAIGGGLYMPEPEVLLAVRNHIAENHEKLRKAVRSRTVHKLFGEMQGEQLARVCDMKVAVRLVSFFEPAYRAYMIRSVVWRCRCPNRSLICSYKGPQFCGKFPNWKSFAPGRSPEPVAAVAIPVAIVIIKAIRVTDRIRD
jgi:uncharacterized protein (TIGR02453 family)